MLVLTIGQLMDGVLEQIDLSVGSIVAFTGSVGVVSVLIWHWPWWLRVLAVLITGVAVGAWQGFWVAFVGIPGFIVSLSGMLIFRGLAQILLNYQSIDRLPKGYCNISNGFLSGLSGGPEFDVFTIVIFAITVVGFTVSQVQERMGQTRYMQRVTRLPLFIAQLVVIGAVAMAFAWRISHWRGLPVVLIILAAIVMVYGLIMRRTGFGRHIYAIGGKLNAAQLSGAKVKRVTFGCFVNMGLLAGVGGVLSSSLSNDIQPFA